MPNRDLWESPDVVPSLAYDDVLRAVEWLQRVFGFRERAGARLTWTGAMMTWMEIGDSLINLSTSGGHHVFSPKNGERLTQSLKVYVADVDQHFEHAKAEGATIISEPEDGFWGGRIYRVTDLEGHLWEISQRGRDLAAKDWKLPPGLTRA